MGDLSKSQRAKEIKSFRIKPGYQNNEKHNSSLFGPQQRDFLSKFGKLCQTIGKLVGYQIPIDFKITICPRDPNIHGYIIDDVIFNKCLEIYSSCFQDKKFLVQYTKPKCNNGLCTSRERLHSYLERKGEHSYVLSVTNVEYL